MVVWSIKALGGKFLIFVFISKRLNLIPEYGAIYLRDVQQFNSGICSHSIAGYIFLHGNCAAHIGRTLMHLFALVCHTITWRVDDNANGKHLTFSFCLYFIRLFSTTRKLGINVKYMYNTWRTSSNQEKLVEIVALELCSTFAETKTKMRRCYPLFCSPFGHKVFYFIVKIRLEYRINKKSTNFLKRWNFHREISHLIGCVIVYLGAGFKILQKIKLLSVNGNKNPDTKVIMHTFPKKRIKTTQQ